MAAPLKSATSEIPFDPLMDAGRTCARRCSLIKVTLQKASRFAAPRDAERELCASCDVTVDTKAFGFGGMRVVYRMVDSSKMNEKEKMVAKRLIKEPHACKEDMLPFCRCTSFGNADAHKFR